MMITTSNLQHCNPPKGYCPPPRPIRFVSATARRAVGPIMCAIAAGKTTASGVQTLTPTNFGRSAGDEQRKFLEIYSLLKSELLNDPAFDFTNESRQWLHQMMDYNVPRGKLGRALDAISCYQLLREGKEISEEDYFLLCVLGWCIQWLQANAIMIDDIIDDSDTRRGQPCWSKLSEVGMIATNDVVLLQTQIFRVLKMHFREKPYYVELLDVFNEVAFQTACGQMLDVITPRERDLSKYSMELYHCISKYKGAYLLMYLPVACALILAGEHLDDHLEVKDILIEITVYYQIMNDYQDCFEDPEVTGKVGTDIEDGKCSWFIVKALEHANEEQRKTLYKNYGKSDPACVAKVKEVYESLDLRKTFKRYEEKRFEELKVCAEMHPSKVIQAIWATFVGRMTRIN